MQCIEFQFFNYLSFEYIFMKELHQLVKSLNPQEKKYFRRFGLKDDSKGQSSAEVLFEILDAIDTYDEEKLAITLRRKKLDKQAAHVKHYLFDLLLDTLTWYHKENLPGLNSAFDLARTNILEDRGLDVDATQLSSKWIAKAKQQGSFTEKWEALGRSIYQATNLFISDKKQDYLHVEAELSERGHLLSQMALFHRFDAMLAVQHRIMRTSLQARTESDISELENIYHKVIEEQDSATHSLESRFVSHVICIHHYHIFNQWDKLYDRAKSALDFVKENGVDRFVRMKVMWLYAQLTQVCYYRGLWDDLEKYLAELIALPVDTQTEGIARFTYYTQLALVLHDHKGEQAQMDSQLAETETRLAEFGDRLRLDIRLSITITCVSVWLESGEYEHAVGICEDFLTHYDKDVRLDSLLMLYVYEFICHLELGNAVYLNNTIQNVYRYFRRHGHNGQHENALLGIFRKLSQVPDAARHKDELKQLMKDIEYLKSAKSDYSFASLLPLVESFIEAKINGVQTHEWIKKAEV